MAIPRIVATKSTIYADEPFVFKVTGVEDRESSIDWAKITEYKYDPAHSRADSDGWVEIGDLTSWETDSADLSQYPTSWTAEDAGNAILAGEFAKVLAYVSSENAFYVFKAPRSTHPKFKFGLQRRQDSIDVSQTIVTVRQDEVMPESLRALYYPLPVDTSLKFGDLSGRHLIVNNIQDVSAGVEVAINNNSSHTGTAIVHVEIRDSAGIAVAVAEDASAHFDPAPFLYIKTWPVITLLQPSTNYTAHYTVFDSSNGILLSGGGVSFKTNAAPVQVTPLDITGISATKTTLAKGESVTFTITHNNGGLKPIAWSWYLNGGPFSGQIQGETATTMQTTLQEPGTYMITGQGVDAAGDGDYAEVTVTVTDSSTPPPTTGKSGAAVAALFIAGAYALSKAGKGRSIRV